ncbi:MAG: hypothetical protein JWS12_308, partial [Candidatus Saccharibacteria bacterium]|nr:hypothetical protein [Candidatus Saccharibacteria bacterium]
KNMSKRLAETTQDMPIGVIDQVWANDIAENGRDNIWEFNWSNGAEIAADINLDELGGLAVRFSTLYPVSRDQRVELQASRSIIDLAFEEPAYSTLTSFLLDASKEQREEGAILTYQLDDRTIPARYHGGDEAWFIPTRAIQLIDATRT